MDISDWTKKYEPKTFEDMVLTKRVSTVVKNWIDKKDIERVEGEVDRAFMTMKVFLKNRTNFIGNYTNFKCLEVNEKLIDMLHEVDKIETIICLYF